MAIYRGPGGSGDAVNDSSSETRLAVEARDAAIAAQAAAEAAQVAAELAETNAETAETNAETAETNAETAATNAASSASAASTSASNASSSASSASTSATNAASSASAASSSASAASTSATNAATSATNAANSATAAATSATNASNSATAAASSASSASSSASTATTQASNASTSATNAASSATSAASSASTATTQAGLASTSATNAANSASAASTSATNASNSASAASTSASNAATSATAAQTAETNAETAQAAAEAARDAALSAYDNFDDRYLGPKASDPTLDNDGNALLSGALYFNTTTNVMKVYTGSSWVAAYVSAAGVLLVANNLSDLNNAATARTNLGLGTAATTAATDYATAAQGAKADTALQPATIGVSVQGYDANTAKLNAAQSWSAAQSFNAGVTLGDASGDALTINSSAVSIPNGLNFDSNTFFIDATNNRVGVGTASPGGILHTVQTSAGAATTGAILQNADNSLSSEVRLLFAPNLSTNWGNRQAYISGINTISGGTATALAFGTAANGAAPTEKMRIDTAGNVGIGTSTPASIFHVDYDSSGIAPRISGTSLGRLDLEDEGVADSSRPFQYLSSDDGSLIFGNANRSGTGTTSSTERMRINSSGNVGIGTSSPSYKLEVRQTTDGTYAYFRRSSGTINPGIKLVVNETGNTVGFDTDYSTTSPAYTFSIGGTERMRLDSSGNLGLGVTPSAWSTSYKALEINGISLMGSTATNDYMSLGVNFYFNGTNWIYKSSEYSTRYYQVDGTHQWFTAPSGTAGNAITFTQAMTLDASGNLGVGVTSPRSKTDVYGTLTVGDGNDPRINLYRNVGLLTGSGAGRVDFGGRYDSTNYATGALISGLTAGNWSSTSYGCALRFHTTADGSTTLTERMRIDSSGNVGIGTSSPSGKLAVIATTTSACYATADSGYALFDGATNSSGSRINISGGDSTNGISIWGYNSARNAYTPLNYGASQHIFKIGSTEYFRFGPSGQLGIGGANYGTAGQALVSNGSGSAPSWQTVSGGQYFGTATTKAIAYNSNTISENITVTAGNNGLSAGPVTVSTGYTVTVETGANWVIV